MMKRLRAYSGAADKNWLINETQGSRTTHSDDIVQQYKNPALLSFTNIFQNSLPYDNMHHWLFQLQMVPEVFTEKRFVQNLVVRN